MSTKITGAGGGQIDLETAFKKLKALEAQPLPLYKVPGDFGCDP